MCGGKKKSAPAIPWSQTAEGIQWQAAQDRANADRAAAEKAAADAKARAAFDSSVATNYNQALSDAQSYVGQQGLNWDEFMPLVTQALTREKLAIPDLASNVGNYFDPNIAAQTLNTEQSARQNKYSNTVNQLFGQNFENNWIPNTADDSVLNAILASQSNDALSALQRSQQRGTLTGTGYQTALSALGNQKSAASSKLQDIGQQVLAGGRSTLSGTAGAARTGASNYKLGGQFDPYSFETTAKNQLNEFNSGLEGALRGAVGDQSLFDINALMQTGGAAQGGQNTAGDPNLGLLDVITDRKRKNSDRGLGSQGQF